MIELRHKPDGTPYLRPYLGRTADGKQIRPYREFPGMSDEKAEEAALAWLMELEHEARLTVGDALDRYVRNMEAAGQSANTVRTYRLFATRYAKPIRAVALTDVTAATIDDLFHELLTKGANACGKPLSRATVQTFKAFLQGAWRTFAAQGITESNTARDTMRVQQAHTESLALCEDDVRRLVQAVRSDLSAETTGYGVKAVTRRNQALAVLLALNTGARVGEIAALRRCDVSHARRDLTIGGTVVYRDSEPSRQNKTKGGKTRHVAIDEDSDEAIRKHEEWQRGYIAEPKRQTPLCTVDGRHMNPSVLSRGYRRYRDALDLDKRTTFHSLRHTHATLLLQSGLDARVVQERLGHANVSTTLSIYGHVMPGRDQEAARRFAGFVNDITD